MPMSALEILCRCLNYADVGGDGGVVMVAAVVWGSA